MDPKKSDECCSILGVLPSVANKVGQIASELLRVDEDLKERKRERERARFTSMSEERRNELNKKRRELYQRKKGDATLSDIIIRGKRSNLCSLNQIMVVSHQETKKMRILLTMSKP